MSPARGLFGLLVFPGLLYALPMGWLMLGLERKLRARFQGRIGPPITQPFYDVVKLLAKTPVPRVASDRVVLTALPLLAVGAMAGALALIPALTSGAGFSGDLILLVGLLELPPLCLILAGYASRSIFGEVGATREAVISIASNVPFLAALVAMATAGGTLQMQLLASATPWAVRGPALLALALCLPVKLRLNPFSLANAEQEILAGPLTELDGRWLALWELAHGLEWVALTGLMATLVLPPLGASNWIDGLRLAGLSLAFVVPLTLLGAATARLKIGQVTKWLWRWPSFAAVVAMVVALVMRHGGH